MHLFVNLCDNNCYTITEKEHDGVYILFLDSQKVVGKGHSYNPNAVDLHGGDQGGGGKLPGLEVAAPLSTSHTITK